jgi:DNA-binding NarL/FixJ family response regulator
MVKGPTQEKLHIFVVDDSTVLRLGLRTLIEFESDMRICGEASNAQETLEKLAHMTCDVAIVDISLTNSVMDGIALTVEIKKRWPKIQVLLFSMHMQSVYVERAVAAGAHGYIMKDKASDDILRAIRQIVAGGKFGFPAPGTLAGDSRSALDAAP